MISFIKCICNLHFAIEIELTKNQITSAIEQVTMHGVNLKTLGLSKTALEDNNDLTSEDGMLKEYKRLSIQLKQLQILKKRTADQLTTLSKEEIELRDNIAKFENLNVENVYQIFRCIKYKEINGKFIIL